jgi:hypothetical protein
MNTLQPKPFGAFPSQRQAFEAWYEADAMPMEGDWFRRDPDEPDEYDSAMTNTAWRAWQAATQKTHQQQSASKSAATG